MISTENSTCMHIQIIQKVLCALSLQRNVIEVTWSVNCQELLWANKIVQYTAVFTLLLYKYVFLQLLQYCWNLPFCVSVFLSVFCQILVFHGWHSIGILVKLGLGNIFDTPLAAPHIFLLIALLLTQLPKSIPFWHTQGGLREDIKYYFADIVCKGEGGEGGYPPNP